MKEWSDARVLHAQGAVADGLEAVGDAFAENFDDGLENGASFHARRDGEPIVDIAGGVKDRKGEAPFSRETIVVVYSSGKAALAALVARAVDDGVLDYDAPIADIWPEFGARGKDRVTLADAMSHQAGLPGFADDFPVADYLDWDSACAAIAAMAPAWPPGKAHGYHPQTIGFIVGEVLRRARGTSVGALLRAEMTALGGGARVFCGLSEVEIAEAALITKPPRAPDLGRINAHKRAAFLGPASSPSRVAREVWMMAEIPASNMHANARGLANLVEPLAGINANGRGLRPATLEQALRTRCQGDDLVLPFHLTWAAGLMRNAEGHFGPSHDAFGHYGFGGSCVVIDPVRKLSMAYVMNKLSPALVGDPRPIRLIEALYRAIG